MLRPPFVWKVQVRREVLDDELIRLREVPYRVWRQTLVAPLKKTVIARDNKRYDLRVTAQIVRGSDDVRVTVRLARQGLFPRRVMRQTFVIGPDDRMRP